MKLSKIWILAEIVLFAMVGTQVNITVAWKMGLMGALVIFLASMMMAGSMGFEFMPEADQGSIDTKTGAVGAEGKVNSDHDPTVINGRIRELLSLYLEGDLEEKQAVEVREHLEHQVYGFLCPGSSLAWD